MNERKEKSNKTQKVIIFIITIVIISGTLYYQFIYDPTDYRLVIDCDNPYFAENIDCTQHKYMKSIETETHLKTGKTDYTVNIVDGIGSSSP